MVYLLNESATGMMSQTVLSHTPSQMYSLSQGYLEGEFTIVVFTRSHYLLILTRASGPTLNFQERILPLESTPLHLIEQDK